MLSGPSPFPGSPRPQKRADYVSPRIHPYLLANYLHLETVKHHTFHLAAQNRTAHQLQMVFNCTESRHTSSFLLDGDDRRVNKVNCVDAGGNEWLMNFKSD